MDDQERALNAYQFKDRYDLNEQQANRWGKFLNRKAEYSQRYGTFYADILLKKEKEALEALNDREHKNLDQQHDQQWLDYHDADVPTKMYNLPEYLEEREAEKPPGEGLEKDITERASAILERFQQSERTSNILFPNPFKKNIEQEKAHSRQTNDIEQSQEYMNSLLLSQRKSIEKEKSDTEKISPISMSMRFSQGLGYIKSNESIDKPSVPGKEMDRE